MTKTKQVPVEPTNEELAARLKQLARAIPDGDWPEFYMSIPARPHHDADIVMTIAAERLTADPAEPLGHDFAKVLYDNLPELYEGETTEPSEAERLLAELIEVEPLDSEYVTCLYCDNGPMDFPNSEHAKNCPWRRAVELVQIKEQKP